MDKIRQIQFKSLIPFLLMVFGICWGIFVLILLFKEPITSLLGEISGSHPLFILAVYSPAITALILIFFKAGGAGVKGFLSRFLLWRCSAGWYAFLLLGIPLIYIAGSLVKGNLFTDPFPFESFGAMISSMAFMLVLGPVEEFGWRGYALPLLQRRMAPFWAATVLGVIWGVWHLPAFLLSGTPQSAWSFTPFVTGALAVSIILTPMFNKFGGSILLAALFHFQLNNPLFPDAQPYDTIFFVLAAALIVWFNRHEMFDKSSGVTEVIPGESGLSKPYQER